MNGRTYMMVSGTMLGVIGIGHLVRIIQRWELVMGPWTVPLWASGVVAVVFFAFGLWGWIEAGKLPRP
jgi:hypothetical protein